MTDELVIMISAEEYWKRIGKTVKEQYMQASKLTRTLMKKLLLPILMMVSSYAMAKDDNPRTDYLKGWENKMHPTHHTSVIQDPVLDGGVLQATQDALHRIRNTVYFYIDESGESNTFFSEDFEATVRLRIVYTT